MPAIIPKTSAIVPLVKAAVQADTDGLRTAAQQGVAVIDDAATGTDKVLSAQKTLDLSAAVVSADRIKAAVNSLLVDGFNMSKSVDPVTGVITLTSTAGSTDLPGLRPVNMQNAAGLWSLSKSEVDLAHASGNGVEWTTHSAANSYPTPGVHGLAAGDTVNRVEVALVTVGAGAAPVALDVEGTISDKVRLTNVPGVTWVVNGVQHTSASFGVNATKDVAYTAGVSLTVTALPEQGYLLDAATTSWNLTFTDAYANLITSETFDRADATISAGTGSFTTNAGKGGAPVACDVTGGGFSILNGKFRTTADGGLRIPANKAKQSITVLCPTRPASGSLIAYAVRGPEASNAKSMAVDIWDTNARLYYYDGAAKTTDTVVASFPAGAVLTVEYWQDHDRVGGVLTPTAGKNLADLYINGTLTRSLVYTGAIVPTYAAIASSATGGGASEVDYVMVKDLTL